MVNHISYRLLLVSCIGILLSCKSDPAGQTIPLTYPAFSSEQEVNIQGYSLDAMEPFITKDGNFLFFNSLNDGINTSLYYATKITDTNFQYIGEIVGANGATPHLDAVASMDRNNVFYFVSTRNYPAIIENFQTGKFNIGAITQVHPVAGSIYRNEPGWILMDGEINGAGTDLYYVNAKLNGNSIPEETKMCLANKQDSLFTKYSMSDNMLARINDPEYLNYAPSISSDGKELYFTRARKGTSETGIFVSTRTDTHTAFSIPHKIEIQGSFIEAPTMTEDGTRMYYHKKLDRDGKYHIFTLTRN